METFQQSNTTIKDPLWEGSLEFPLIEPQPSVHEQESEQPFGNAADIRERSQQVLYAWFVRYNPLYFFSAMCVLVGMLLVSQDLGVQEWTFGQLSLTGIMWFYEMLLIAGAALLFRGARQTRPAVILAILSIALLFDCTFRAEVATTLAHSGRGVAVILGLLAIVKVMTLAWIFRVKLTAAAVSVPFLSMAMLAGMPQLFEEHFATREVLHLVATLVWIGLSAFVYWKRPALTCVLPLTDWGKTVLRRVFTATLILGLAFYGLHLVIWMDMFEIPLTGIHLIALLLLVPLFARQEWWVWAGCINVLGVALLIPTAMSAAALAVTLIMAWQAWRMSQKRLTVGIILTLYLAVWTMNWQAWPLPEFNLLLSCVASALLVLTAWRFKLPLALVPLLGGIYPLAQSLRSLSGRGWGTMLLIVGFFALLAGVAVNWTVRAKHEGVEL